MQSLEGRRRWQEAWGDDGLAQLQGWLSEVMPERLCWHCWRVQDSCPHPSPGSSQLRVIAVTAS